MRVKFIAVMLLAGVGACAGNRNLETGAAATDTVVTDQKVVQDTSLVERVDTVVTTKREADTLLVTTDTAITVDTVQVDEDAGSVTLDTTRAQ
jgi:hypothetical protein